MDILILKIKSFYSKSPLLLILIAAFLARMLSVIFSKGFGMYDDHFVVVETAQSFVDGYDYNHWLPSSNPAYPGGHSWLYPGFIYVFFSVLEFFNITDPQIKMYVLRFFHALFSLLVVIYGYRITKKIAGQKTANTVAWLLSLLWFMPFFSVRNMVEFVCVPFMIYASWLTIRDKKDLFTYFISGIIMGLSVSVRFQCAFFLAGFALGILLTKKWKEFLLFCLGFIICFAIIQGTIDYFIWGKPFTEFREYVRYNFVNATSYVNSPWYNYILLISGILIPPVSIILVAGYLLSARKNSPLFFGVFVFILFHSIFPNKQERFILPVIPFIVMLGIIGWNAFHDRSAFWTRHRILLKSFWIFFWCINIILLPFISTMYSKRSRVETMCYLSKYKNLRYIAVEETNHGHTEMLPLFYLQQWDVHFYDLKPDKMPYTLRNFLQEKDTLPDCSKSLQPSIVLFYGDEKLAQRLDSMKSFLPGLVYEKTIEPGFIDKILYELNPRNANQTIYIYRNTRIIPDQI